jgi:3-phenylpropionate/trans-cinnamate dioxygenase ferredoxin reductase component
MAPPQYVIVGGGLAGASAIEGIRAIDKDGPITLLTSERELPYHRPPLSKSFLAGKGTVDDLRVQKAWWYPRNNVRVRLNTTVKSLHLGKQSLTLENGERVAYDRVLLATGSSPRHLNAPGIDSQGVFYLRTLQDCYALKSAIKPGVKLVLVGGGFIGMEVAATARLLGADVTVLEMGPVVYRAFANAELSAFFKKLLEDQGVKVRVSSRVAKFRAEEGAVAAVVTETDEVPCDMVVIGAGAEPNTEWLANSGLGIDRGGVIVNVRLETNTRNVWAAGDIARFVDPLTRQPRRLEHWDNAQAMGRHAGRNMAGANEPYHHQSAFFSDLFDITINVLGDTENPDSVEIRGDMGATPNFTALYTRNHKFVGAVTVNEMSVDRAAELEALQKHLAAGTMPD